MARAFERTIFLTLRLGFLDVFDPFKIDLYLPREHGNRWPSVTYERK